MLPAVLSASLLILGGCASDAADEATETEAAPSAPAPTSLDEPATAGPSDTATGPPATAGAPATVTTGKAAPYGRVLTDGTGMTLYVFFEDVEGQSRCYDACAENWPPLLTEGDPAGERGAKGRLLGTLERDDGAVQVTYDGQPLYLYAGDSEPGDVRGFGSGNVWYPVTPAGAPIDATGGSEPAGGEY